jgi:hypothetical protein
MNHSHQTNRVVTHRGTEPHEAGAPPWHAALDVAPGRSHGQWATQRAVEQTWFGVLGFSTSTGVLRFVLGRGCVCIGSTRL